MIANNTWRSDLGVFERLAKRNTLRAPRARSSGSVPPPPPPTLRAPDRTLKTAPKPSASATTRPTPPSLPPPIARSTPLPAPPQPNWLPTAIPRAPTQKPRAVQQPKPVSLVHRAEATPLRIPDARRTQLVTGFALGVVASAAIVFYFMPHAGQIAVNVADSKGSAIPHLSIYVDGKKQCDSAPCFISDVAPGPHAVRVDATGFEPPAGKAVAVESRKDTTVDFSLALLANGGTGIRVTGTQPGTELFVDDKEIGSLPQTLHDMAPGSHKEKISGNERYAPLEETVTVTQDELQNLGPVTLKVVKGKATLARETPGATVFLVSGSNRWELPALPISIDIDTAKEWSLVASKPGFNEYTQPISIDDGQSEKALTVALDPKAATAALDSSTPASNSPIANGPTGAPNDGSASRGLSFLRINSIPASSVTLDGKPIGSTPKLKYRVSPGAHSLAFVNLEQGFKKQISVTVAAGETTAAVCKN